MKPASISINSVVIYDMHFWRVPTLHCTIYLAENVYTQHEAGGNNLSWCLVRFTSVLWTFASLLMMALSVFSSNILFLLFTLLCVVLIMCVCLVVERNSSALYDCPMFNMANYATLNQQNTFKYTYMNNEYWAHNAITVHFQCICYGGVKLMWPSPNMEHSIV